MEQDLDKLLTKTKIDFMWMKNTTFLSTVMCSLEYIFDESVGTAATNGKYIKICPSFFLKLTPPERVFLLAHETMHVIYQHMLRRGQRDHQKYNAAADYVINLELYDQGLTVIKGALLDPKYAGMSTEQVYDLLPDSINNPLDGDLEEASSKEDSAQVQQEIQSSISRAVQLADMREAGGSVPDSVRRMLHEMVQPKVNWRNELRRFMQALNKYNHSWARPNKRYQDVYLPSIRKQNSMEKITFSIDTSGSVTDKMFQQFLAEIYSVLKMYKPDEIVVTQFDHLLQSVDTVKNLKDLDKVIFTGKGGTAPEVALRQFIDDNSKALFVITDGFFRTKGLPKPRRPVVWVIFNNNRFVAPFGKAVHIKLDS